MYVKKNKAPIRSANLACRLAVLLVLQEGYEETGEYTSSRDSRKNGLFPRSSPTTAAELARSPRRRSACTSLVIGVGPGHALLVHLPQRPPAAYSVLASAMLLLNLLPRRRINIGTAGSSSTSSAIAAALMVGVGGGHRGRRRCDRSGELLHDGAELGRVDDVHRRGRGVPAPPVRRSPAAGSVPAALHQGRQQWIGKQAKFV
jgi:hypothetical protein